jgi:uncharacterized membrane protein YphA (DoxX/SURF4 family)
MLLLRLGMLDAHLNGSWWALRLAYGLVPIVAGFDKFSNVLVDWKLYLSPVVIRVSPVSPLTFIHVVGVIEIAAGILVLSKLTRLGAYLVSAWLFAIALNLLTTGYYFDIAVRDFVLSIGAFTLARMTEARGRVAKGETPLPRRDRLEPFHVGA